MPSTWKLPLHLHTGTAAPALAAERPPDAVWRLYPEGQTPGSLVPGTHLGAESLVIADTMNDPVGNRCAPGGHPAGHYIYNVIDPEVEAYLVQRSHPNWTDTAVLIAPGGGDLHLAIDATGRDLAMWWNSIGVSAFVVKYRVPTQAWAQGGLVKAQDMQRAISMVRQRASELGLNASRIGAVGSSAGGAPAVDAATMATRSYEPIDAVDSFSFRPSFLVLLYPALSGEAYLTSAAGRAPPTFIAMAADDPCVSPASVGMWNAVLGTQNVISQMNVFPHGGHGWGTCNLYPHIQSLEGGPCGWRVMAQQFLRTQGMLP